MTKWDTPEKLRYLVEEVECIGAEPFHSPEPLPPIETEEIHLIAWMAIEREAKGGPGQSDGRFSKRRVRF